MYLKQADFPPRWPDGRPCPFSSTPTHHGNWPVVAACDRGDVWQLRPDAFAVFEAPNCRLVFRTLAEAVAFLGG